jgi:hypothetical protein
LSILAAQLYDPLGIVSPILFTVKVLFQEICVAGLDWDIEIPDEMKRHWNAWLLDLKLIKEIIINRCLYGLIGNTQNCTLHGFSDASMKAYSLLAEVSICAGNSKEKRPLPRSDTSFIDNSNINSLHLNRRGLHLTHEGSALLQANIGNILK